MKNKQIVYMIATVLWLIACDLDSKYFLYNKALWSDSVFLQPILNTWISRSVQLSYMIVIPITLVALFWFVYLWHKKYISWLVLILLLAWSLWNLYDRVIYYGVRDFFVFFDWFIFNLADTYISVAFIFLVWWEVKGFFRKN